MPEVFFFFTEVHISYDFQNYFAFYAKCNLFWQKIKTDHSLALVCWRYNNINVSQIMTPFLELIFYENNAINYNIRIINKNNNFILI